MPSSTLRAALAAFALGSAAFVAGRASAPSPRVFELRTYTTLPGRLDALHARFRDHTMALFERHGMRNEGYWVPVDSARRENTLVYIISHESREAADRNWAAFAADPDWVKARDASEADGKIVAKVDRVFMTSTSYSPQR
ncbi:MAG: NIPSNAP family protein [Gemmatimonadetes bacterium]|nr:NIPSNAP family protein [Gemmatimonadota bacterium]